MLDWATVNVNEVWEKGLDMLTDPRVNPRDIRSIRGNKSPGPDRVDRSEWQVRGDNEHRPQRLNLSHATEPSWPSQRVPAQGP